MGMEGCTLGLDFGEVREAMPTQRLPKLQQPARLDLTNALAGDAVGSCHFLQRARLAVAEAEAKLDHFAFARRQRPQHFGNPITEQVLIDGLARVHRRRVVEEILKRPFAVAAQRLVQTYRMASNGPFLRTGTR